MTTPTRSQMIARRVQKGYSAPESLSLLAFLVEEHAGDNLAFALHYNEFTTEAGAAAFAAAQESETGA